MYKRFDDTIATDGWDAIIIGSGPGGLCCAATLARAGQKVLVLEKHYEVGGFCHTFKRKEWEWDVGVHYIGGVQREISVESRVFSYIGEDRIEWAYMDSPYDVCELDGKFYNFVPGSQEQIELWISYFPEEEDAIRTYWKMVKEATLASRNYFAERAVPKLISTVAGPFMTRKFQQYASRTTYEVLKELTDNETLITVLCAQCGDYGLPPKDSSFGMHAMLVNHYRGGGNYPVGGASTIGLSITKTIENHGGTVVLRSGTEEILIEDGKATGVRIESGQEIRGRQIISGAGVVNTFGKMLPKGAIKGFDPLSELTKVKESIGHMCLYLGLDRSDEDLKLPKYNYWCYDPYTGDPAPGGRLPSAYISFPSAKDPEWQTNHPGTATVQCIALGLFEDVEKWADTKWKKRGEDYDALKEDFKEHMLKILLRLHPEITDHIAWAEVSTPLSTIHFSNYEKGEIYGLEHNPARFKLKWLRPRTPLPGLYLTGQDICTAGVAGALMSGLMTASTLLKKNVVEDIMKGTAP